MKALDLNSAVYVLDDGVLLSGNVFQFESIEHVATACLHVIQSILQSRHPDRINSTDDRSYVFNLGGWSYGGVVAAAVSKLIRNSPQCSKWEVSKLFLFDSPLRVSCVSTHVTPDDHFSMSIDDKIISLDTVTIVDGDDETKIVTNIFRNSNEDDLTIQTNKHFNACTDLLKKYHLRPAEQKPLICAIYDLRPIDSAYECPIDAVEELTVGKVTRRVVTGNHWTMLFNEHAPIIAQILTSFLNE